MQKILECKIGRVSILDYSLVVGVSPEGTRVRGVLLINVRIAMRNSIRVEDVLHFHLFFGRLKRAGQGVLNFVHQIRVVLHRVLSLMTNSLMIES